MSCPYTSQQNGRAERKHRHIAEFGLTLLAQAQMPLHYWWEAFSTAVYLINRLPSQVTQNESPYSLIFHKEPDYKLLKPFGCACYPCLKPYNQHKLQFHTTRCVFLGYSNSHKGYKCLNSHGRTFISRHVIFNEDLFPFHEGFLNTRSPLKTTINNPSTSFPLCSAGNSINDASIPIIEEENQDETNEEDSQGVTSDTEQTDNGSSEGDTTHEETPDIVQQQNVGESSLDTNTSNAIHTRSKSGIHKPKLPYIGITETYKDTVEPANVKEALTRTLWKEAMQKEFQALMSNKTWILVPYQDQENIVDSKWVFKTKYKSDGSIERRKARLVAKGFQQTAGIDYEETFSPVVKASTVRVILSIAVHLNWEVRQLDINNAFLNGYLKETVFMHQPEGFVDPTKPNHICKLSKAIYGLKQAPRAWFDSLKTALLNWGFQNTKSDPSLFLLKGKDHITFLLIYVDDIIVTGSSNNFLQAFIKQLNDVFSLKDLGRLHYFLGIEVQRDASGMYLKQSKYIGDLLKKFKMENASPCPTPMITGRHFTVEGEKLKDPTVFRQAIGGLQYLTHTRPDIAFSVNKLSQYMSSPTTDHWQGIKRILRYLQGTINYCMHIKPSTDLDITGFSDADWATSIDDRKSMAGQCVFLGETLISWSSRKQKVVSRSSTESEYRALADLAAEIAWIRSLLFELKLPLPRKPILWCDNLSAKALASNPVLHARSKHIEIDVHYIRDQVLQNKVVVAYVPTTDQIADCLTKPLSHTRFSQLRDKLGVIHSPPV